MKQRFFFVGVLMITCALAAFAQNRRSNLAILPFTGGQGNEGETVAELFSFDRQLMGRFGIIPRTSITRAVEQEQDFQMSSGMTDADTIAKLGAQLGAPYVMAGSITALGGQKLLVVTIIRIETVQQVAGDYLMYTTEEELAGKVSGVVQNLLPMLDIDTSRMEKLAILPVQLGSGASARDADTLAQILSIELMRNESYAIYPRTGSLDQVQQEFETQNSGVTDYRQAAELGRGENPRQVLSVVARRLGTSNMFNASIIELEYGTQIDGTSQEYADMRDGITVMDLIARVLSGQDISTILGQRVAEAAAKAEEDARAAEAARAEEEVTRKREEDERKRMETERKRAEALARFNQNAGLAFAIQGGMGIISEDIIGKRIFGDPPPLSTISDPGFPLDVLVGLQYSWFSINTGASFGLGYVGPSQIEYSFFQVPVLFRGDWNFADHFGLNAFMGMGFNVPLKATAVLAAGANGEETTYDTTLVIPPSIMLGGGYSGNFWYMDLRFVFDLAKTEAKRADGRAGSFFRTSFDVLVGVRYRLPFSKSNR